jgi:hypothetical protein
MAVPLLFMLGASVLRAATPVIARELTKLGAKKVTQKVAKESGKKIVNVTKDNLGTIRTVARPKSGAGATKTAKETVKKAAQKAPAKSKPKPKTKADAKPKAKPKAAPKKKAPELKADPKDAPKAVKDRAAKAAAKKAADKKPDPLGGKVQRGLIAVATTAPFLMDTKPKQTAKADSGGRRITSKERAALSDMGGQGKTDKPAKKEETFGQAFSRAYAKGVGTKFSHGGKEYVAVKESDVDKAGIKKDMSRKERLRAYLNKKSGKAKGGYASKNNKGTNDYRMGGMLLSVEDRRKMK